MPRKGSSSLLGISIASCIGGVGGLDKEKVHFCFTLCIRVRSSVRVR